MSPSQGSPLRLGEPEGTRVCPNTNHCRHQEGNRQPRPERGFREEQGREDPVRRGEMPRLTPGSGWGTAGISADTGTDGTSEI